MEHNKYLKFYIVLRNIEENDIDNFIKFKNCKYYNFN